MQDFSRIISSNYVRELPKFLPYGTAGFRDSWSILHTPFFRVGLISSLRSSAVNSKYVGVMITASHNGIEDNGIKIVDQDGGMLVQSWEAHCEVIVNAANIDSLIGSIKHVILQEKIQIEYGISLNSSVIIGRDTRYHSNELSQCVKEGIEALYGNCIDLGEVTTPQLHYVVQHANESTLSPTDILTKYSTTLSDEFITLLSTGKESCSLSLIVDAAGGVGSLALHDIILAINNKSPHYKLNIDIRNESGTISVNEKCGAEYVQKLRCCPSNGINAEVDVNKLMCSFDGDADRIVFHAFFNKDNSISTPISTQWTLFDGDKLAILFSVFLSQELMAANLSTPFTMGVIQTAYANGASTAYLNSHGITVQFAKTGVKYLHPKAHCFDIGIYFEANGHGTVLFSPKLQSALDIASGTSTSRADIAVKRLKACYRMVNQAVGDAISDMLLVLASLELLDMDMYQWDMLYHDLPSRQLKVPVPDKSQLQCNEDETRLLSPAPLQLELDRVMLSFTHGRCFVRPSGTEDVVRIYAEAETQQEADALALATVDIIHTFIGTLGDLPTKL